MLAVYKQMMRRLRGQISGWSIGIGLYGVMMALFYDSVQEIAGIEDLLASYPPELLAFFGEITSITTPVGYLDTYFFSYMTVIFGIFAVLAGAKLLVGDEERGVLDLVLAHPVSRDTLFWGRWLAFVTAAALVLLVGWLSWVIPAATTALDLTLVEFARPFLPLFAIIVLFGSLALFLSLILPAARLASALSGALLVGNFLLLGLWRINADLDPVVKATPLYYYQSGRAVAGLKVDWLVGLLAAALLLTAAAWWRFRGRDVRVGGEGGRQLPRLAELRSRG